MNKLSRQDPERLKLFWEFETILQPRLENTVSLVDNATYEYCNDDPVIYLLILLENNIHRNQKAVIQILLYKNSIFPKEKLKHSLQKQEILTACFKLFLIRVVKKSIWSNVLQRPYSCGRSIRGITCSHLIRFFEPNSYFDFVAQFYSK